MPIAETRHDEREDHADRRDQKGASEFRGADVSGRPPDAFHRGFVRLLEVDRSPAAQP